MKAENCLRTFSFGSGINKAWFDKLNISQAKFYFNCGDSALFYFRRQVHGFWSDFDNNDKGSVSHRHV